MVCFGVDGCENCVETFFNDQICTPAGNLSERVGLVSFHDFWNRPLLLIYSVSNGVFLSFGEAVPALACAPLTEVIGLASLI